MQRPPSTIELGAAMTAAIEKGTPAPAEVIKLASRIVAEFPELELRIALLPPLSRGLHLAGPRVHAERLVALWRSDDPVPLGEAFRLLVDVDMVAGAILRTIANSEHGYPDPRHWRFPDLEALLPELRACAWQEILAGRLLVEASGRALTPATLYHAEAGLAGVAARPADEAAYQSNGAPAAAGPDQSNLAQTIAGRCRRGCRG